MAPGVGFEPSPGRRCHLSDRFFAAFFPFFCWGSFVVRVKCLAGDITRLHLKCAAIEGHEPACFAWKSDVSAEGKPADLFGNVFNDRVFAQVIEVGIGSSKLFNYLVDGVVICDPWRPEHKQDDQTGYSYEKCNLRFHLCEIPQYMYRGQWIKFFVCSLDAEPDLNFAFGGWLLTGVLGGSTNVCGSKYKVKFDTGTVRRWVLPLLLRIAVGDYPTRAGRIIGLSRQHTWYYVRKLEQCVGSALWS